jgi:uncharacterized protein (TIGR02996 family)
MTTGDGLLQAVLDDPADEAARLVYADWLDEQAAPLGEVVRLQWAWRGTRNKRERAGLEDRMPSLPKGLGEVAALRRLVGENKRLLALDTALLVLLHAAVSPAAPADAMPPGSVWHGSLRLTREHFGTTAPGLTLSVAERSGGRLRGAMRLALTGQVNPPQTSVFCVEGLVVSGRHVALVTVGIRGMLLFPESCQAQLDGTSLRGTWRSPSWGGEGGFGLLRVEE